MTDTPRYCNRCGYAVHHQSRGTCPECGTFHDRAHPRTWSRHPVPAAQRRQQALVLASAWTAAAYLLALLVATGSDQYAFAQLLVRADHIDNPFSCWLTLNSEYLNPLRLPRLFIGSVLIGAAAAALRGEAGSSLTATSAT